jgi:glycosyltransferase involved in cell wall biosynthesis
MNISILNGTGQVDYLYGLVSGLACNPSDQIDVLDIELKQDLFGHFQNVNYLPVFKPQLKSDPFFFKLKNLIRYYSSQCWYIISHKKRIIHFQWLDRHKVIDRVMLPMLTRLRGHKIVLTVHNINAGKRDNHDTRLNRLTLKTLYKLAHRLIVHTPKSKQELMREFNVPASKIAVIKHGMNNRVSQRGVTVEEAKAHFGIKKDEKVLLFFGNIDYYKGVDILIDSLFFLPENLSEKVKVIIAGNSKSTEYTGQALKKTEGSPLHDKILAHIKYIPDSEVEYYFMAADCIVLPYRAIYQSGVIFMAYTFGLPLIVTDVGNFRNDVIEGKTGFLVEPENPEKLAGVISGYFQSGLYENLENTRVGIQDWAWQNYSWESIGVETKTLYESISQVK